MRGTAVPHTTQRTARRLRFLRFMLMNCSVLSRDGGACRTLVYLQAHLLVGPENKKHTHQNTRRVPVYFYY